MAIYNKYGLIALEAAKDVVNPEKSWSNATKKTYKTISSQKKGCPKNVFLGLCEEGLVKGIKPGVYLKNSVANLNKKYALLGVALLKTNPNLSRKELWIKVEEKLKINKRHNSQMDVVLALWESHLIVI
jgi:hypothetical protein